MVIYWRVGHMGGGKKVMFAEKSSSLKDGFQKFRRLNECNFWLELCIWSLCP